MEAKKETKAKKTQDGVAIRDSRDKTVLVKVTRKVMHPKYGKFIRSSKKYLVHDQENVCRNGDTVRIIETRPISRWKRWKVDAVLSSVEVV